MATHNDKLHKRNRELRIINTIAHALNQSVDLNQALDAALKNVAELLDLDTSWIWLLREDTGVHYLAASQNLPPALRDNPSRMEGWCYCVDTFQKGDLKGAANVNVVTCSRLKNLLEGTGGLRYHASIPLYAKNKKIGILNVASTEWRRLSKEDLQLLNTIGDLLGIAVERARLFERSAELGAIEERYRLARELHDTLGQGLAAVLLRLEALDALFETGTDRNKMTSIIDEAMRLARSNLDDARRAVLDLRAAPLDNRTLREALHALPGEYSFNIDVQTEGEHPLPLRIEAVLYRIAQETLNNIAQHAEAQRVQLSLITTSSCVQVTISDNGKGFDPDRVSPNRYGLIGLNERVRLHNGTLNVESTPGKGTRIDVQIPLENAP